jgi:putative SOS response-associated peptidase YedK
MCSRYSLTSPPEAVRAFFGHGEAHDYPPRYNIAPTQPVAIVRQSVGGGRELALVRWGLLPPWVKNQAEFATLINARAETAAEKPSFRGALRHRRCLIPTDGFYEWTGKPGSKQPHLIRAKATASSNQGHLMAMAGLWEHWVGADGSELQTMAILTVSANATMAPIHDRMPVILARDQFDGWLDCRSGTATEAMQLMVPAPDALLEIIPVSPKLNPVRAEGPEVQEPFNAPDAKMIGTKLI